MTRFIAAIAPLPFFLVLLACADGGSAGSASERGAWRAEVDTIGDTIVVHTVSGSIRGISARLVEELRIGRSEGEEHEFFGRIGAIAVTRSGDILVYDTQIPALHRFASDGTYLGKIGRGGSGPGEYRNAAGMAVLEDGRIVLNDFGNGRFNLYDADGRLMDTWLLRPTISEWRPVHVHPDGVFLHDMHFGSDGSRRDVLVRLNVDGEILDTLAVPHTGYRAPGLEARSPDGSIGIDLPFAPLRSWTVTPAGEVVTLLGNRYAVDIRRADGSFLRISRQVPVVPVRADERAAEERRITAFFRQDIPGWRWEGPPIPATKPPVYWVHAGLDGRLWVRVAQPGTALPENERSSRARSHVREPLVFDVYDEHGRFLSPVHAPATFRTRPYPVFAGDTVWGMVTDAVGVEYVARFRVESYEP
jgi:hypothetical protein